MNRGRKVDERWKKRGLKVDEKWKKRRWKGEEKKMKIVEEKKKKSWRNKDGTGKGKSWKRLTYQSTEIWYLEASYGSKTLILQAHIKIISCYELIQVGVLSPIINLSPHALWNAYRQQYIWYFFSWHY